MLQRHSTARPTSRDSFRVENRAGAVLHARDHFAERSSRLHEHLLREHGRTGRDIHGLPLADLHRFEHVEQAMGLNDLSRRHPAAAATRARAAARGRVTIPLKLS